MTTQAVDARPSGFMRLPATARLHLRWLGAGLVVGFAVPFLLADLAALPRDLYLAVYAAAAVGFFVLWARRTGQPLGAMLRRRRAAAVALGVLFAGVMALIAVRAEDASARPEGIELVGALLWRGVVYGAVDGLLLSVFPILAVFAAFAGSRLRARLAGRLAIGALALLASLAMTAAYHAGYSDFRSDKLEAPLAGDVVWSAPTLVTLNPVGAPIAHVGLHSTAVLHNSETDLFLPPHAE